MMHAAVITAYQDFHMLLTLVRTLKRMGWAVYVHVDTKAAYSSAQLDILRAEVDELVIRYKIFWGSRTHLLAVLDLMARALNDEPVSPLASAEEVVQLRFQRRKLLFPFERRGRLYALMNKVLCCGTSEPHTFRKSSFSKRC